MIINGVNTEYLYVCVNRDWGCECKHILPHPYEKYRGCHRDYDCPGCISISSYSAEEQLEFIKIWIDTRNHIDNDKWWQEYWKTKGKVRSK